MVGVASPSSITRSIQETEAIKEDFGKSLAQLKQVLAKLMQENNDHAQRAEVLMKEMDEMRKGLVEMQMEGPISQGKLESSIASINDLFKQREGVTEKRMSEMAAIMTERDRQADDRWKLMSVLMHRRDTDVDEKWWT